MNFELTDDQKLLQKTVTTFVKKDSPVKRFRDLRSDELGYSLEVWRQMGELGWLSVILPESVGGFGGSFIDAALMLEAFGTTLVPEPFVSSIVMAAGIMADAGQPEQIERWLEPLMEGETTAALAYVEDGCRFDFDKPKSEATKQGSGYRLTGDKRFVLNGHAAHFVVVSAMVDGEVGLFVVDSKMPGVTIQPIKTFDGQRAANIRFENVELEDGRRLDKNGKGLQALSRTLDRAAAAACAEGVGIVTTALKMTNEYLQTREQFGVKIGSFQALQHRAVDMFVQTELCKSSSIMASIMADSDDAIARQDAISAAKVQMVEGGRFVTQQSIQLHGGVGITDEHDIGLYFKRMHVLNTLFGDEEFHLKRFAASPTFLEGVEVAV
jgi:alkylation response protein AidB-like acyl-CoA dehydrogenase